MANRVPRRDFISSSLTATAAIAGIVAAGSLVAPAEAQPVAQTPEGMKKGYEIIPHDSGPVKDAGVDIVIRLTGDISEDVNTFSQVAAYLKDNQQKYGGLAILERGPRKIILRLAPPSTKEKKQTDCLACHMPACYCSCFSPGAGGGQNCATCAHTATDHY